MSLSQSEMTDIISQTHKTLDAAGVPTRDYFMSARIPALIGQRDSARADAERLAVAREAVIAALDEIGAPNRGHGMSGRIRDVGDDLKAAIAERDTLKARLAALPDVADPRDPPVESAAEATVKRLRSYLSQRAGVDYTGENYDSTDFVEIVVGYFSHDNQTIRELQGRLERAEDIAKEQFGHRLRGI